MGEKRAGVGRNNNEILPPSSCHDCLPSPGSAQVQRWGVLFFQQSQGYSCGRRKRQANFGGSQTSGGGGGGVQETDVDERFFLPTGQGCTCNTNGRKRRQAPGEDEPGTRFFGGLFGGTPHCGNCCYNTQPFNNNGFNSNFQNQGFNNPGSNSQNRCQCDYSKTFSDQNGLIHGACQRSDNTG